MFLKLKGAGGLHEMFFEIDFMVVSDKRELYIYINCTFDLVGKYCF